MEGKLLYLWITNSASYHLLNYYVFVWGDKGSHEKGNSHTKNCLLSLKHKQTWRYNNSTQCVMAKWHEEQIPPFNFLGCITLQFALQFSKWGIHDTDCSAIISFWSCCLQPHHPCAALMILQKTFSYLAFLIKSKALQTWSSYMYHTHSPLRDSHYHTPDYVNPVMGMILWAPCSWFATFLILQSFPMSIWKGP